MTRYELHEFYMDLAIRTAKNSYCVRRHVGCVIAKGIDLISYGFNGTLPGHENFCELPDGTSKPEVVHAEANAILKVANSHKNTNGATIYITLSPCVECAKMIVSCGIEHVVYMEKYKDVSGISLIHQSGVDICSFEDLQFRME